jgi:hypothetical protein
LDNESLVNHDIYVSNLIFGEALFMGLKLPPAWDLGPGVSHPEIAAAHDRRGRKWVVTGDAWYVVFDAERKWAMELGGRLCKKTRWSL